MLQHPQIDPVALELGPLKIHWYGLAYMAAFLVGWWVAQRRTTLAHVHLNKVQVSDMLYYIVLGVIVGGRIGYMLVYGWDRLMQDPLSLFKIWEGGMSFHGGLIGCMIGLGFLARKYDKNWFDVTDFMVVVAPIGLFFGRLANFINQELWGRVTSPDFPFAMVFPIAGPEPRHPSPLYEAVLEGLLLAVIMLWFSSKPRPRMAVSGLFLAGYGLFRFSIEFWRQPDAHMGYIAFGWMTTGQALSAPMFLAGMALLILAYTGNRKTVFSTK